MTKEEKQIRTNEKVQAIETLCKQLQVSLVAYQKIGNDGIIQNVVLVNDLQKYETTEAVTEEKNEA